MLNNAMRISGLASGMDIDQMVDKLMKAERMPLEQMKQRQQILEWRRDDYREMNNLLQQLDQTIFDGIFRQKTFLQKTVTSTNETAVSARASGLLNNTTTQIKVSQLAKAATGVSGELAIDPLAPLADQFGDANIGTEFTLKAFQPDGSMKEKTIQFDPASDSLQDVLSKINNSGLGVTAFFDAQSNRISIASQHTGAHENGAEIIVDEMGANLFTEVFNFDPTKRTDDDGLILADNGQNAKFELNGLETERTSNTFTINNITYTLKDTTSASVMISTSTNVDDIYDEIEAFVEKYNETIEKINDVLGEKRYRDFPPLTDAQREEMTEHEIELWEEKAKSGMLYNDTILPSGLNQMRIDLYRSVDGLHPDQDQLSEFGIVTSSNYRERGKLIIQNPEKLRQAIANDPDAVYALFNKDGDSFETKGIAERLRDTIARTMERIEEKAGNVYDTEQNYTIGKRILSNEKDISAFERRLQDIEARYYRQFTRMEQAIQRANQQSMFLMNAFSQN